MNGHTLTLRLALVLGLLTAACGDDGGGDTDGGADGGAANPCVTDGVVAEIGDNHPSGSHQLSIPLDDVLAGEDKSYDIQGNNTGHGHTVTVSADDFAALSAGETVELTSSNNGSAGRSHTHPVTLYCGPES